MSSPFDPTGGSPYEAMTGPLARLHAAIDEVLEVDALRLSDSAALASVAEIERGIRRLPAARHALVAEIDVRGVAETHQVRNTAALLRQAMNLSRGEAGMWVKQATEQVSKRDLTSGEPRPAVLRAVAAAVRSGVLSGEQTQIISATMRAVPAGVSTEQRERLETDLVTHAAELAPEQLARVCRHALDVLDPDGPPPPEDTAARVGLVFGKTRLDGLTPFKGIADPETRAALQAALAPLAQPVNSEVIRDTRSRATRLHDALRDLALRQLASGGLPSMAGLPATLLLSATLEQLEARTGLVSVLNGGTIPVADVIRMAGHMQVVPIVFTATGQALYCGQDQRLATLAIRRTTAAQDRGCVIPGCDQPIMFCQQHHTIDWIDGGETDVDNLAWVCSFHHHRINGWTLKRRNGRVWCTAPPWLDPTGTPRLNSYFHPPTLINEDDLRPPPVPPEPDQRNSTEPNLFSLYF